MSTSSSPPQLPEHRSGILSDLLAEEGLLESRLAELDVQPLLLVYGHLTGDTATLDRYAPYIKGAWGFEESVPDEMKAELRGKLIAAFKGHAEAGRPLPPAPSRELLGKMVDVAVGAHVPEAYYAMIYDELNFDGKDAKTVQWRRPPSPARLAGFKVLVIGAGFSGIAMGAKLKEAGYEFTIVEKNDNVGGTWYENTYPGIAVDTPNHFYSYSFRMEPNWDHYFARGDEIQSYIETCYGEMGIADHVRFEQEVVSCSLEQGPGAVGRDRAPQGRIDLSRALQCRDQRRRSAQHSVHPGHPRNGPFHGTHVPLRALGPRPRLHGQDPGGDRHGRFGPADRSGLRRRGRQDDRLPALAALGAAQSADLQDGDG